MADQLQHKAKNQEKDMEREKDMEIPKVVKTMTTIRLEHVKSGLRHHASRTCVIRRIYPSIATGCFTEVSRPSSRPERSAAKMNVLNVVPRSSYH